MDKVEKLKLIFSFFLMIIGIIAVYMGGSFTVIIIIGVITTILNPNVDHGLFGEFMMSWGLLGIPVLGFGIYALVKSPILRKLIDITNKRIFGK